MDSKKSPKKDRQDGHDRHDGQDLNDGQDIVYYTAKNIQAVLTLLKGDAGVFEAIRDSNNKIVDFGLMLSNSLADGDGDSRSDGHTLSANGIPPGTELFKRFSQVVETGKAYEVITRDHQDGNDQWFNFRITPFQNGILISLSDVSDKKKAEEAVIQKMKILESLVRELPVGVSLFKAIRDGSGKIVDFEYAMVSNKEKEIMVHDELEGKRLLKEFPHLGYLKDRLSKVVETGMIDNFEMYLPDRWLYNYNQKLGDGVLNTQEDITRIKELEAIRQDLNTQLLQKSRELQNLQAEIKTFNAIASNEYHDTLRNLYTSMEFIISNDARNLSNPGKANIRRAQVAIQKMKMLTEDIVSYLDIHADNGNEEVDLNDVLSVVINDLRPKLQEANGTISKPEMPVIRGYRHLLIILLTHLIDNAIKFRKEGSSPEIKILHHTIPGTELELPETLPATHYEVITVSDNGEGFPAHESEKIFELFYRQPGSGRHKGSGIGLAICKKIMDIHRGMIRAECNPDCTIFHCYFPVTNK